MKMFKLKFKNRITSDFDTESMSSIVPLQNVYSAYNRLPSPSPTFEDIDMRSINNSMHRKYYKGKIQIVLMVTIYQHVLTI